MGMMMLMLMLERKRELEREMNQGERAELVNTREGKAKEKKV
jgi:hypothetical protein